VYVSWFVYLVLQM